MHRRFHLYSYRLKLPSLATKKNVILKNIANMMPQGGPRDLMAIHKIPFNLHFKP